MVEEQGAGGLFRVRPLERNMLRKGSGEGSAARTAISTSAGLIDPFLPLQFLAFLENGALFLTELLHQLTTGFRGQVRILELIAQLLTVLTDSLGVFAEGGSPLGHTG